MFIGAVSAIGASLLDGYVQDLATDPIYPLTITQSVNLHEGGTPIRYTLAFMEQLCEET